MASRKVASLFVDVTASTAKLTGGLEKAVSSVNKFKRRVSKQFASVKRAVFSVKGAVLGLAGAAGFGMLIKSSFAVADNIGKMSDRLNMSAETFQALHHQAGLFGVSSEMVNSSVERMVKRLGEAANGTGAAKRELDKLNISAKEMIGLNADEQYTRIAEAIGGLATHSERAAATAAIFGREGIKMVGMFADGAGGIKAAREELDSFGITMDRVQIKKIENANDSFHRVTQVIKGAALVVSAELAPYLEVAAKWFLEGAKQAGGFGSVTDAVMSNIVTGIGYVLTALDYMEVGWQTIKVAVLGFADVTLSVLDEISKETKVTAEWFAAYQSGHISFFEWFTSGGEKAGERLDQIREAKNEVGLLGTMTEAFGQASITAQAKLMTLIGGVGQRADAAKTALAEVKTAADEVANIQVDKGSQEDEVALAVEAAKNKSAMVFATEQEAVNYANAWAISATAKKNEQLKKDDEIAAKNKLNITRQIIGNLSSLMSTNSEKLFKIGKAASLAQALIGGYVAAVESFKNAGGYPWGIAAAAASLITTGVQVGKIKSQTYSGAREFGGRVLKDRTYKVGERGTELFTPDSSGEITSNRELQGGNREVTINIVATDSKTVEAMFKENRQALFDTVVDAMNEDGLRFA